VKTHDKILYVLFRFFSTNSFKNLQRYFRRMFSSKKLPFQVQVQGVICRQRKDDARVMARAEQH
jgi:transposase